MRSLITIAVVVSLACIIMVHAMPPPPTIDDTMMQARVFGAAIMADDGTINVITASSADELHMMTEYNGGVSVPAEGEWHDTITTNGWSTLVIRTDASFNDTAQAHAAGHLEGVLTQQRTHEFLHNMYHSRSPFSSKLTAFLHANTKWVEQEVKKHHASDPYWYHIGLLYTQLRAMYTGYLHAAPHHQHVDWDTYYASTLQGDMDDLCTVYGCDGALWTKAADGHCSVLVKPLVNNSDILFGHTTWSSYTSMTRIYKQYSFKWTRGGGQPGFVAATHITFPSYPGCIYSNDDWYQTDAGLAITETTIDNNNASLWQYVTHQTVLDWARNMVANRFANSGAEWAQVFSRHNSGTYNNQFMIVDYKLFTAGQPLQPGLFTVLEQMPGNIVWQDQTNWLIEKGYWASYNRPFYPAIWRVSNQDELVRKHGDHYTWNMTARAQIFRGLQGGVKSGDDYGRVIRHNDFMNDAVGTQACKSGRSASNAISERGDLTDPNAGCLHDIGQLNEGGTDAKYTTAAMMKSGKLTVMAQSGPTYDQQPPFVWSKSPFSSKRHIGLPDEWKFPWVQYEWKL